MMYFTLLRHSSAIDLKDKITPMMVIRFNTFSLPAFAKNNRGKINVLYPNNWVIFHKLCHNYESPHNTSCMLLDLDVFLKKIAFMENSSFVPFAMSTLLWFWWFNLDTTALYQRKDINPRRQVLFYYILPSLPNHTDRKKINSATVLTHFLCNNDDNPKDITGKFSLHSFKSAIALRLFRWIFMVILFHF